MASPVSNDGGGMAVFCGTFGSTRLTIVAGFQTLGGGGIAAAVTGAEQDRGFDNNAFSKDTKSLIIIILNLESLYA